MTLNELCIYVEQNIVIWYLMLMAGMAALCIIIFFVSVTIHGLGVMILGLNTILGEKRD
jgi:hypothetical protein